MPPSTQPSSVLMPQLGARSVLNQKAVNDSPDDVSPVQRMTWLIELMSRYAREIAQSSDAHESPRIAAAIVMHLRSLSNEMSLTGQLSDTADHWMEMWDAILALRLRNESSKQDGSLRALVQRAQAF